jgi:iron complex outermembrane recepter protein
VNSTASRFATLMGSASILTLSTAYGAYAQMTAQVQTAQAGPETVPEQVLVTGSLIHGTAAVGVPVTNLGVQDFTTTGYATIGELFQTIPAADVTLPQASINGGQQERLNRVNIRGLDATGPRSLLMVDGVRYPPQADGLCVIDPSFIPALALDRIDVLADGASATYGSDAIAGVINVVLKRGYDGATTLLHVSQPTDGGGFEAQESQLWGRTWDGGDITLTYEHDDLEPIKGNVHSRFTINYTPWGLDNENPIGASIPATISTGKPNVNNGNGVSGVGTICPNCYAVPSGAGSNFNAAVNNGLGPLLPGQVTNPISWASLTAGTTNEVPNALALGWEDAAQQKNAMVATFDQRLFPGVSLFFTGFYSNRRVENVEGPDYSNGAQSEIKTFPVPTINPYYPVGAPAGLNIQTDLGSIVPTYNDAFEISARYSFGLNLDLPFGWTGQIYDSRSYETDQYYLHFVDSNYASNALGNVVNGNAKPASIPYLNLFCDQTKFACNSPATINYISSYRHLGDVYQLEEKGARFDGPLFDLPGGQVKAAIGGDYESDDVLGIQANYVSVQPNGTPNPAPSTGPAPLLDPEPYTVWAGFAQLDIPVFGDNFNIPLARRLDLEASWRHDQYSSPNGALAGGTSNPKLAFTWLVDELVGATVRGSWGTSFRFANAGEYSVVLSDQNTAINVPGGNTGITVQCVGGVPPAGSAAAVLVAAGQGCGSTPGAVLWGGGPHAALREYTNAATGMATTREGGLALAPETSENYSLGFELAPTIDFLRGFDFQATFYSVKINNVLTANNQISQQNIDDPLERLQFIFPSDLGCPVADNATPTACAPFQKMVAATLLDAGSSVDISQAPNIYTIKDGSTYGSGFQHVEGVDFNASYDLDLGDYGAWNTGITGTYYLHNFLQTVSGGAIVDLLHWTNAPPAGGIAQYGIETTPRLVWRTRLGWSDGPYSVTGFMNYSSHYFSTWASPPNVNFQCTSAGGNMGGGTFPCAISNYSNYEPAFITFDLSLGYNTGDIPANDYLKHIGLNFTVQNLMGIHSPFAYGPVTANRNAAGYDILRSDIGRVVGLTITKNW